MKIGHRMVVLVRCLRKVNNDYEIINDLIGGEKSMFGLSKEEIMLLLEKVGLEEKQKNAIANILHLNNERIEQQLAFIIHLVMDERERNISANTYLN